MDSNKLLKIIIGVLIVMIVFRMMTCKGAMIEGYHPVHEGFSDYDPLDMSQTAEGFQPSDTPKVTVPATTNAPMATSVDLLPKPVAGSTDFGQFAPKNLGSVNFVDSAKFIGVDTQGSSLRNASWDLRTDPVIPRNDVGPWANSTIEADLLRKNVFC